MIFSTRFVVGLRSLKNVDRQGDRQDDRQGDRQVCVLQGDRKLSHD